MKDDKIHLNHILECIGHIEEFTKDGRGVFSDSRMIQDATLRNLQTLGQSVNQLSDKIKKVHPEIDWIGIVGFRNVLVHDYLGINLIRVWEIVEGELPKLKQSIQAILE
jgi:uncharacterized protein with HEPN domain